MNTIPNNRLLKNPLCPKTIALNVLVAAVLQATTNAATAQTESKDTAYGLSGTIGLGVSTLPTYEGSPNRRTLMSPDLGLTYRSRHWGTVELGQRGLLWQVHESGRFRFGFVAGVDLGRKTKTPVIVDPAPGDKRLAGMGDVRASVETGLSIGYGPLTLVPRQSLRGAQVDLKVEFPLPITERLSLSLGGGTTWADEKYMQTYFGVTAAQASATPFGAFTPRAGLRKVELSVGGEYSLGSNWKLQGNVTASDLQRDAAKSPLVERRSSITAALGLGYAF